MKLGSNATCYACSTTAEVIIFGDSYAKPIFYSPNEHQYFEIVQTGFGGNAIDFSIHYDNPHNGTKGEMSLKSNVLTWNHKKFLRIECPGEIQPVPIPEVRQPVVLLLTTDGTYILVSRDRYGSRNGNTKFFIGPSNHLEEIAIINQVTMRDGGTTYITIAGGRVLYIPTPFDENLSPTFDDVKVFELKIEDYVIVENDNGAQVLKPGEKPVALDPTVCKYCHTKNPVSYGMCMSCNAPL